MLPDPLARLQAQYHELVDSVSAGDVPFDQAEQMLAQMVVVDGAGAQWSIDVEGNFTCAATAGQPAQVADPSGFAQDRLPPRADAQDVPPWADPHLMAGGQGQAPPMPPTAGGGWDPSQPAADPAAGPAGMGGPMPAYQPPKVGRSKHLGDDPDDSLVARVRRSVTGAVKGLAGSKLVGRLPGDKRTGMVIAAGIVLLLAVMVYSKLGTDPLEDVGGNVPVNESREPAPGGALPGSTEAPTEQAPAAAAPSAEDANRVVAALTSGNRKQARRVLVNAGDKPTVALQTASLSGLEAARVVLTAGPATDTGDRVEARFVLADANDQAEYAQATVIWIPTEGGWKLQTWPNFTRIE